MGGPSNEYPSCTKPLHVVRNYKRTSRYERIITILLILSNLTCFGQTDVKAILDSCFCRTKQTSMYSSLINWDSLRKEVFVKAENASTIQELKPAFTTLLNGMLDKHGKIIDAKTYSTIAYFTDFKNSITR